MVIAAGLGDNLTVEIIPFPVSHGTDTTHETVYLTAPLSTFVTPRYDAALATIRERHPHARILSPRELFGSSAEWLRQWPSIRPTITLMYLLPALTRVSPTIEGTIALGCLKEWWDVACEDRKPCLLMTRDGGISDRFYIEATNSRPDANGNWIVSTWCAYRKPVPLYGRITKPHMPIALQSRANARPLAPNARPLAPNARPRVTPSLDYS